MTSDREVHVDHTILPHLQLHQQDHPGSAVAVYPISIRAITR